MGRFPVSRAWGILRLSSLSFMSFLLGADVLSWGRGRGLHSLSQIWGSAGALRLPDTDFVGELGSVGLKWTLNPEILNP